MERDVIISIALDMGLAFICCGMQGVLACMLGLLWYNFYQLK